MIDEAIREAWEVLDEENCRACPLSDIACKQIALSFGKETFDCTTAMAIWAIATHGKLRG